MKLKHLTILIILLAGVGTTAHLSFSYLNTQKRVEKLLQTRECPGCDLRNANLQGADLSGVNLEGANLKGANLEGAKLGNANLKRVNFTQANLERADLGCVGISLRLRANNDGGSFGFKLGTTPTNDDPRNANLGFNVKANDRTAAISFNVLGCANVEGANFQEAKMPDGKLHP
jgi:uncharacterized protein YjbI with pentapeptide repeats